MATITAWSNAVRLSLVISLVSFIPLVVLLAGYDTVHGSVPNPSRGFDLMEDHDNARGVWSGGSTMWVVDNADDQLIAYSMATGARLADKDIDLTSANSKPQGIWSDGSIIWVVDWDDTKLYAYNLDSGARMENRDIDLTGSNDGPRGVWGAFGIIMVVDKDDDHVYAYNQTSGQRLTDYEFDLAAGNDNPWGLWGGNNVIWVTDTSDDSVYAYDLVVRTPKPLLNLRLSLENRDPRGVTGNKSLMWVVDDEDKHVYAMRYKDFRHPDDEIDISGVVTPKGIWTDGTTMYVVDTGIGGGPGLVAYNVGDGSRNASKDVDLSHTGYTPMSIWSDGSQVWVQFAEHNSVKVYSLSTGTEISRNFPIILRHENGDAAGIWCDGATMWVSDSGDDKIYAYNFATGLDQTDKDFGLDSKNTDPGQIWGDGETLWVMDATDKHVYAYDLSTGARREGKEFRPVPDNNNLNGAITGHGLRFWVVDTQDDHLYAYGKANTPPSFSANSTALKMHHSLTGHNLIGAVPEVTEVDEGDTLTYSISGTDSSRFTVDSSTGEVYTKSDAGSFTAGAELSIKVSVSDGKNLLDGVSASKDDTVNVTIRVLHNADPEFVTADGSVFTVSENASAGDTVAQLNVTDLDGDTPSYTLTYQNGDAHTPFTISGNQIKIATGESLDYESQDSYQLTLEISDGKDEDGNSDTTTDDSITVEIQVTNADESGEVALGSAQPQVDTAIAASLTDPDGVNLENGNQVNWVVERSTDRDSGTWTEVSDTDASSATFDYTPVTADVGNYLRFAASYWDNESDTTRKTAQVISTNTVLAAPPSNLPPAFNENAPITRSFPEDAEIGANVGLPVLATDPDDDTLRYGYNTVGTSRFQVNSVSGQINMNSNLLLSYERRPTSYIWVLVRDSKDQYGNADTEWDASALVKINITNVEEPGEVELTSDNPQVAVELAASLTDPDGAVTNLTWQWQTAASAQATTWTDITVATSEKYTPVAAAVGKFVRARASYDDGEGTDKQAHGVASHAVLGRAANAAPEFDEGSAATRSLAEDAVSGSWVGDAVTATDPESDTLTYSLASGDNSDRFAVDGATGRLEVASGAILDFETDPLLTVVVQVSDGLDADHNQDAAIDDTITVTVNLTNVDEAGRVLLSSLEPEVDSEITATLNDPDGSVSASGWQWTKSSDDGSTWTDIVGAISATFTPTSDEAEMHLRATVSYTDGEGPGKSASRVSTDAVEPAVTEAIQPDPPGTSTDPQGIDTSLTSLTLAGIPFSFDSDTLYYEVSTPNSDRRTRVTAAPTAESGVSVSIIPSDSRPSSNGHQVDLSVGVNYVVVTVTHDESSELRVYVVQVTREPLALTPEDDCSQYIVDLAPVHCGSTKFADYRIESNGSYSIDWSKWGDVRSSVTGYTVTIEEYMRRTYHKNGQRVSEADLQNVYEGCEFSNDAWACEGPLVDVYHVDGAGQPTQRHTVLSNTQQTELSGTLGFTGVRDAQETFHRWSGDPHDPNNEPTAVTYTTKTSEVDRYRFVPHTADGDLKTKKITITGVAFANPFAP